MHIGIIGGFGRYGSRLTERLETAGFIVQRHRDRLLNVEIAESSDVLFLSVPPSEIEGVAREIRSSVGRTEVISCAAFIDTERIENIIQSSCVRIMSDPYFALLGVMGNQNSAAELLDSLNEKQVRFSSNEEISWFTKLISVFFVTLCVSGPSSTVFKLAYSQLLKYYSAEDLSVAIRNCDHKNVYLYRTKNGISELITSYLLSNPNPSFDELMGLIDTKFQ